MFQVNHVIKFKIEDFHKDGGSNNNKWLVYVLRK